MIRYIPISFDEIPTTIQIELFNSTYELKFLYNDRFDFITMEVYQNTTLLHSTKLVYGEDCFNSPVFNFGIIPMTKEDLESGNLSNIQIGKETFDLIRLYFDDGASL